MSRKQQRRRSARRKLAAHDRGENRHNKGLAWILKRQRKGADFGAAATARKRAGRLS